MNVLDNMKFNMESIEMQQWRVCTINQILKLSISLICMIENYRNYRISAQRVFTEGFRTILSKQNFMNSWNLATWFEQ